MKKYFLIFVLIFLFIGCANKNLSKPTEQNVYTFRIRPTIVYQTPDSWQYKNNYIETPFITTTDKNDTIAGVLYMKPNSIRIEGQVNLIADFVLNKAFYGNWPLIDCNNNNEFLGAINTKDGIKATFELFCAKVIFNERVNF